MVTTALEHPSAFDAVNYYAKKLGKELRVADTDRETGGVPVENILKLIDQDTILLSVMYTSHFTGATNDIETIVREARRIKPDLFIVVDAVQHAAHSVIDVERTPVDAMNFGVYKFFGCRGLGVAYLSDRLARLPHHKILKKAENEWRLGSPVPLQMASVSAIVDYVCWLGGRFTKETGRRALFVEGMTRINRHERALLERMLSGGTGADGEAVKGLRDLPGVVVCPDCRDLSARDLIVPMGFERIDHAEAVKEYEKRGVVIRETPMESVFFERILTSFGLKGALRISPLHCHGAGDIDRFLQVTGEIARLG